MHVIRKTQWETERSFSLLSGENCRAEYPKDEKPLRVFVTWVNLSLPSELSLPVLTVLVLDSLPKEQPFSIAEAVSWSRHTPYTTALVTEVPRARVGTTGLHLAQRKLLGRDAFCLHVLLLMFVTPFVYQRPSRCPAGYASASTVIFTHCSEPFCTYSNIHWLDFFQCLVTHKWKGRCT